MATVIMPKMGDAMEEGTLLKWLKNEGDPVEESSPKGKPVGAADPVPDLPPPDAEREGVVRGNNGDTSTFEIRTVGGPTAPTPPPTLVPPATEQAASGSGGISAPGIARAGALPGAAFACAATSSP